MKRTIFVLSTTLLFSRRSSLCSYCTESEGRGYTQPLLEIERDAGRQLGLWDRETM